MHLLIFFSLLYCNFNDENCHFFEKKNAPNSTPVKEENAGENGDEIT